MKRKAQFLDKAKKDRLRGANGLLRSFCKGWGESAKQGGVDLQGRGRNAKGGVILQRTFMSVARWGRNASGQPKLS